MNFDVASARQYSQQGRINEWIRLYLHTPPWANIKIWRFLRREVSCWHGPLEIGLDQLYRTCGPEAGMRYQEDRDYWEEAVTQIAEHLTLPADVPPLLVCRRCERLGVIDGNHRHEAFRRRGWHRVWVLIGET